MSEIVIVGGGLAGGAAATLLARDRRRVRVLERETAPRNKICGEFLSIEAQRHLGAVGLDLARLGGAPIDRVRIVSGARSVEAALPFPALGLTRRRLDAALLDHAARQGAWIERGLAVKSLEPAGLETTHGLLPAETLLLASGKHEVRGARRDTKGAIDDFVGFKMYFQVEPAVRAALTGFIEVVLFEGGYAGLQLVEGGVANLCLLVRRARFEAVGRTWPSLFATLLAEPHLARRLGCAEPLLDRPLTISGVPYGFRHRDRRDRPEAGPLQLFRLGDQAAVIPSFSGDGMSIALHSARLASRAVISGESPQSYHARMRRDVAFQVGLATGLQRFGQTRLGKGVILSALQFNPHALSALARWTRVPEPALRRVGVARCEREGVAAPSEA